MGHSTNHGKINDKRKSKNQLMKEGTYEIVDYQIEIEGVVQDRKRIYYYNNQDDLFLIEEYYGTMEEIRPCFDLKN